MLESIGKTIVAALVTGPSAPAPTIQDPPTPPPIQNRNTFNPQISLVTDFRWQAYNNDRTARRRAFLREAELAFASDVDPFLKAEAYFGFHDEDGETKAEVEEAFGRYNNLGRGLSAKFGKIAAAIGRVQRNHVDQLNWLDYPLMVQDFLGEEGLRAGGASLSYLLPGERFHELTLEAVDSNGSMLFGGASSTNPTLIGAYRTFFDFSEDTSAQLGFSFANGPSGVGNTRSQLFAGEFTFKWQPGTKGRSLNFEAEGFLAKMGGSTGNQFGGFAALTYEVMPRVFAYGKVDYSEMPGTTDIRKAFSLGATLQVTEFHNWRVELQRMLSNTTFATTTLNVRFQWAIGAHPAHKY